MQERLLYQRHGHDDDHAHPDRNQCAGSVTSGTHDVTHRVPQAQRRGPRQPPQSSHERPRTAEEQRDGENQTAHE